MRQYLDLLHDIQKNGVRKPNRTGVDTIDVFGRQIRFNLADGFPAVTTKKLFLKGIIHELLWFLTGSSNIKYLRDNGVHIWDEWADEQGELGPVYGVQWRSWPTAQGHTIDQLSQIIHQIKTNPTSRRIIVSAWNVPYIDQMKLPPCHCLFQFDVTDGKLSCQLYQRSADMFLGVPFNIASYALLTMMIAQITGLEPGDFIHTFGSAHIYVNHLDQINEQLNRSVRPLPTMMINRDVASLFDFRYDDFQLLNYDPHPPIKAEVAV